MDKTIEAELNAQIGREFAASAAYLAAHVYAESAFLGKIAKKLLGEAGSEREHGLKCLKFVQDRGGSVVLPSVQAVQATWKSITEVFEFLLKLEKDNTAALSKIADMAMAAKDHRTYAFISELLANQTGEEAEREEWLAKAKAMDTKMPGLVFHLDKMIG